ncbi:MAG: NnrS family protein [Acidobacteriota bacterium]
MLRTWDEAMGMVPAWRREPYRLLFPLGVALAWGGVLHWLLHALGVLPDYRPVFHSIAQIQGFMTCFAVGFLFTAIPRRTGTAPPAAASMMAGIALPVGTTVAAWFGRLALSQVCWLSLIAVLMGFILRRFHSRQAHRRPPVSFVWLPVALGMGVAGSLMTGALGILGPDYLWVHQLGRLVVLQGMFLALTVGVGGMIVPLITRGEAPPDLAPDQRAAVVGHLVAAGLLLASFWIENSVSLRAGLALRGAVVLAVLLRTARIDRVPRLPGWHRWLVWMAAWAIPAGYVLAALFPAQKKAGMHVVFIGGFALMALSVGVHITLAHGGYRSLVTGRPWQVPVFGGLVLAAVVGRALVDFDQRRFFLWLGLAAASFLAGTVFWATLVVPRLFRRTEPALRRR